MAGREVKPSVDNLRGTLTGIEVLDITTTSVPGEGLVEGILVTISVYHNVYHNVLYVMPSE